MLRIAALIHISAAQGNPTEALISRETLTAAVRTVEFFGLHAEAAYKGMGADESQADDQRLKPEKSSRHHAVPSTYTHPPKWVLPPFLKKPLYWKEFPPPVTFPHCSRSEGGGRHKKGPGSTQPPGPIGRALLVKSPPVKGPARIPRPTSLKMRRCASGLNSLST